MTTKTKKLINRKQANGFTLIELMIVAAITAIGMVYLAQQIVRSHEASQAQTAGDNIALVGKATATYIYKNMAALSTIDYQDLTVANLVADSDISTDVKPFFGGTYRIRIKRIGTAAPYRFEALVFTSVAWVTSGKTRLDLVGKAAQRIGGAGGINYDASGPRGMGGASAWTQPVSGPNAFVPNAGDYVATGGQLFYDVAYSITAADTQYLRLDGTNQMTASLNMGNNILRNATDIQTALVSATGNIVTSAGNVVATTGQVNAGTSMTAASGITSTAGNIVATAGDINSTAGAINANTDVTISTLTSRLNAPTTTSLKALAPTLIEVRSQIVSYHGQYIPGISCANGGMGRVFIIPQRVIGQVNNANWGSDIRAAGNDNGPWTVIALDSRGWGLPNFLGLARTFCAY